jgi:hypothetical protein
MKKSDPTQPALFALDTTEKARIAEQLASLEIEYEATLAEKKESKKQFTETLAGLRESIVKLAGLINMGGEAKSDKQRESKAE